jgi:vacuolar iron transporter family protein
MGSRGETARYLENWQDEVDSAAEYRAMAAGEPDPRLAKVWPRWRTCTSRSGRLDCGRRGRRFPPRRPSWRSRVLGGIARRFGPELVLATIAAKEEVDQNAYLTQPEAATTRMSSQERWHATVLEQLVTNQRLQRGARSREQRPPRRR